MNTLKLQHSQAKSNDIENARWIAEQAILTLSELTPQSQQRCAEMICHQLGQVNQQETPDTTLTHDELSDIAELFKRGN